MLESTRYYAVEKSLSAALVVQVERGSWNVLQNEKPEKQRYGTNE